MVRSCNHTFHKTRNGGIPKKVGSDFRGEAFRVLKEKEKKQYGEYRTRRLIWNLG
jgi:hypothetical protein